MTDTNFKQRFQRRITLKLGSNFCMFLANTALTWQYQWPGLVLVSASFPCLPMWFSYVELDPPTLQLNSIFPSTSYSRPYKLYNKRLLPPANEVWGQGDVFTPVCHSVHRGEGNMSAPLHAGLHTPLGRYPTPGQTPPTRILRDTVNKRAVHFVKCFPLSEEYANENRKLCVQRKGLCKSIT